MIYVDAIHGNDRNNGSMDRPLQSILQAVKQSTPGEIIQLEKGIHVLQPGTTLELPHDVTLRGRGLDSHVILCGNSEGTGTAHLENVYVHSSSEFPRSDT